MGLPGLEEIKVLLQKLAIFMHIIAFIPHLKWSVLIKYSSMYLEYNGIDFDANI